ASAGDPAGAGRTILLGPPCPHHPRRVPAVGGMNDTPAQLRRVVFLAPIGAIGGAERVLLDMVASLRAARPELRLHVIVGTDGPLRARLAESGAEVTLLRMPESLAGAGDSAMIGAGRRSPLRLALGGFRATASSVRYAAQLRQVIGKLRPDVVHS